MKITFDEAEMGPLIERVVAETVQRIEAQRAKFADRLAYPEPEAAALLGVKPHVLRDARLRGEVRAARLGKRLLYAREELLKFLARSSNQ